MLIAETGGLNAMIVDSTALPEQAVRDILASAFQSAGQRCSALRVLYVQKDVEAKVVEMLKGAMDELKVGDPWSIATDVGPVIDDEARDRISDYCGEDGSQGQADRQGRRAGGRALRRAAGVPRVRHRRDGARGVRAGAACRDASRPRRSTGSCPTSTARATA